MSLILLEYRGRNKVPQVFLTCPSHPTSIPKPKSGWFQGLCPFPSYGLLLVGRTIISALGKS